MKWPARTACATPRRERHGERRASQAPELATFREEVLLREPVHLGVDLNDQPAPARRRRVLLIAEHDLRAPQALERVPERAAVVAGGLPAVDGLTKAVERELRGLGVALRWRPEIPVRQVGEHRQVARRQPARADRDLLGAKQAPTGEPVAAARPERSPNERGLHASLVALVSHSVRIVTSAADATESTGGIWSPGHFSMEDEPDGVAAAILGWLGEGGELSDRDRC